MIFRFGSYQVVPATRQLWDGPRQLRIPRRVFDAIVYLIAHRHRAVSKDELIEHVWHRPNVSDVQLNQLLVLARRVFGDDGQSQSVIRTVPGFGYHWIAPIEEVVKEEAEGTLAPAADDIDRQGVTLRPVDAEETPRLSQGGNRRLLLCTAAVVLVISAAIFAFARFPAVQKPGAALRLAVLPTEGASGPDTGWIRLGIMDLIANHLRDAGLSVSPSENVLALLHAAGSTAAIDVRALQSKARVHLVLHSRVTGAADGWQVELRGMKPDGLALMVNARGSTAVDAAVNASDRLLEALGRSAMHSLADAPPGVQEILQRAEAAHLANNLDTARVILANTPPDLRVHPLLQLESAQIARRAGQFELAESTLRRLLNQPEVKVDAATRARILCELGAIELRRERFKDAEHDYRAAIDVLPEQATPHLTGRALMGLGASHIGLKQLDSAAAELMRAKNLLEYAGDGLFVARVEANIAALEGGRFAYAEALPIFTRTAAQFETYGAINEWAISMGNLLVIEQQLLRWSDGLATSDRAAATVARIVDPGLRAFVELNRAEVMLGVGRLRDADALIAAAGTEELPAKRDEVRQVRLMKAQMALARGYPAIAENLSRETLTVPSIPELYADEYDFAALVYMRALRSRRVGTAADLRLAGLDKIRESGSVTKLGALRRAAYAEWLQSRGEYASSLSVLRAALSAAQEKHSPVDISIVVQSLADLLLSQGRLLEARNAIALVLPWADQDFNCAVLAARLYKAEGHMTELNSALTKVRQLAGERPLPQVLQPQSQERQLPGSHVLTSASAN